MRTLALVATWIVAATVLQAQGPDDRIAELQAQNQALRRENAELRARVEALEAGAPDAPAAAAKDANAQLVQLRRQLEAARAAQQDLQAERTRLEQLAGMTAKGDLVESRIAMIRTTYDAAADRTTVASVPEPIQGPGGLAMIEHRMSLSYSFPGRTPAMGPAEPVHLDLLTRDNSDDRYKHLKTVTLLIDGQSLEAPVAAYDVLDTQSRPQGARRTAPRRAVRTYSERLRLALDRPTLNRISAATDMQVQLYNSTYTFTRENLATFVAIRERLDMR